MAVEKPDDSAKPERVLEWWKDESERTRVRGRPLKHYGRRVERHRAAVAAHSQRRKRERAFDADKRSAWRAKRAEYMRRYRAEHPAYAERDNTRRKSQRVGTNTLVPPKLDGLNLSPSTLRALTARSVDYSSAEMGQLMEEQPELAEQVLARYFLGLVLMANAGFLGWLMASSVFGTLPGVGGGSKRKGRESIFDKEWKKTFSPIAPLDARSTQTERCGGCGGNSFAEDFGRGERFCLDCGAVVSGGPRLVGERSARTREH